MSGRKSQIKMAGETGIAALLGWLLRELGAYRLQAALMMCGLLVEVGFEIAIKLSFKFLIDAAIIPRNEHFLLIFLGGLIGIAACAASASLATAYLWAQTVGRVVNDLRRDIFEHLQRLSIGYYSRTPSADLISRFSYSVRTIDSALQASLPNVLAALIGMIFGTVLLFWIHWRLAILSLFGLALCFASSRLFGARAAKAGYDLQAAEAEITKAVQENIFSQNLVKAFALGRHVLDRFGGLLDEFFGVSMGSHFINHLLHRTPRMTIQFLHLAVLGFGAFLAIHGRFPVGSLVSFNFLFLGLSSSLTAVTWGFPSLGLRDGGRRAWRTSLRRPAPAHRLGQGLD